MRPLPIVLVTLLFAAALAGCTAPRDLNEEARDREAWARDHNDHRPVAVLSGPKCMQPGALVWYSAHGSHDPDFFGAQADDEREQASEDGGVHYEDDATHVSWSWTVGLDLDDRGLGVGIREHRWQIDDGPVLVAPELTDRYGAMDGPVRLPVGFTEPGTHTVRLTVEDWSGETDSTVAHITVCENGTGSTIPGWTATESGWTYTREVDVSWMQYGDCQPVRPSQYDAAQHNVAIPFDLFFYMQSTLVEATWEAAAIPTGLLSANLNDVDVTMGHCELETVWARFEQDTPPFGSEMSEGGEVDGAEFARHIEIMGGRYERTAAWDFNAYLSDEGDGQWGSGTTATLTFTFVPAADTGYGGY